MERRSDLAPLVVALLLAAFVFAITAVGVRLAWKHVVPTQYIQPGFVLIEELPEITEEPDPENPPADPNCRQEFEPGV